MEPLAELNPTKTFCNLQLSKWFFFWLIWEIILTSPRWKIVERKYCLRAITNDFAVITIFDSLTLTLTLRLISVKLVLKAKLKLLS